MDTKKKRLAAAAVSVLIFLSALVIIFAAASAAKKGKTKQPENVDEAIELIKEKNSSFFGSIPDKTVFAVYGTNQNLSDVIFVGSFDRNKKTMNIINVPRDTFVVLSDEYLSSMRQKGHYAPEDGMKINEVHNYGGDDGNEYLTLVLQDLLGVDINYYFEVNLEAFSQIVDAVGGVEIDVPQAMYYSDPSQDLYIDLQPGLQTLDGDKALQFVRFRKYPLADIQRIEMQKLFLKAFTDKLTSVKALVSNAPELASILVKNTKSNLSLKEAVKYTQYIKDISSQSLSMETLPGEISTPYMHDPAATAELVNRFFYDGNMPVKENEYIPAQDSIKNNNDDEDYKEPVRHYYDEEDDDDYYEDLPIKYDNYEEPDYEEKTSEYETVQAEEAETQELSEEEYSWSEETQYLEDNQAEETRYPEDNQAEEAQPSEETQNAEISEEQNAEQSEDAAQESIMENTPLPQEETTAEETD